MTQALEADQPPLLILINNDAGAGDALRFQLELEGYEVAMFRDASSVLLAGFVDRARCLVIDFDLPDMDGLTLLGRLRERGVVIPAVLTAGQLTSRLHALAAAQSVPIVNKPMMDDELVEAVARAAGGQRISATRR